MGSLSSILMTSFNKGFYFSYLCGCGCTHKINYINKYNLLIERLKVCCFVLNNLRWDVVLIGFMLFNATFSNIYIYFSYIVAVGLNGRGNRSTRRKPPTCCKSLTNLITYCCIEYTSSWSFDIWYCGNHE
jgi:hypothetical protein